MSIMRDLSRMAYTPKTPRYKRTVKAVMGIFATGEAETIDIVRRIEAADLLGQTGDPRLEDDNWVTIPTGAFFIGAQSRDNKDRNYDPLAFDNESPVREVALPAFRIGRFPVTVQEFDRFVKSGGYEAAKHWEAGGYGVFQQPEQWDGQKQYPNRPVTSVSWYEAAAYCRWAVARLPTEEEWERAARGPASSRLPWGDTPPLDFSRANYNAKIRHATPVGLFPKGNSLEGLCDMLGNVWEWCADWYGTYDSGYRKDPRRLGGREL